MPNSNDMLGNLMNMLSQDGTKEKMADMLSGLLGNSGAGGQTNQNNSASQPVPPANAGQGSTSGGNLENLGELLGGSGFTPENMEMLVKVKKMMDRFNDTSDNRIVLLNAIKPFMAEGRTSGIDMMVRLIQVMNFSSGIRNMK